MKWRALLSVSFAVTATTFSAQSSVRVLDDFERSSGWESAPSDGVTLRLSLDTGLHGRALRVDFDFHGGGGYAVFRKPFDLALPANYAFAWQMRARARRNNLELKLVDSSGDNVWWSNQRDFAFPETWTEIQRKKRHVEFAWGPLGGGDIRRVKSIEFAITAGSGGKGTVWLDDFPKFIGDMPHTWVAADFIRSAADFFANERERNSSLVIGAGVRPQWLGAEGVSVRGLGTHYGALVLSMRQAQRAGQVDVRIAGVRVPPGGVVLRPPVGMEFLSVRAGGDPLPLTGEGDVRLRALPPSLTFTMRAEENR